MIMKRDLILSIKKKEAIITEAEKSLIIRNERTSNTINIIQKDKKKIRAQVFHK